MKFVDEAFLTVQGGKGGDGSRSFRREKFIPFGGPNGGDGGTGGSIYLKGDSGLNTLVDFRYIRRVMAENADCGHGNQMTGCDGEDKVVRVPIGTVVWDEATDEWIGEVTEHEQTLLVAKGGARGLGNMHFKSSVNRAPKKCTPGKPGEVRELKLELKVLADVGLLGLPNAGKSTFLSVISSAKPKIADYPFTTLHPNLGVVRVGENSSFVVADIPGVIEGASEGHGLGHAFLKHISRNRLILHLVDIIPETEADPLENIAVVESELEKYDPALYSKARWLVFTKMDRLADLTDEQKQQEVDKLTSAVNAKHRFEKIFFISALTKESVETLCRQIMQQLVFEPEI
jgi:GTP-binding protein